MESFTGVFPAAFDRATLERSAAIAGGLSPELLLRLIESALCSDHAGVRRQAVQITNSMAGTSADALADQIRSLLKRTTFPIRNSAARALPTDIKTKTPLVDEEPWPRDALFLEDEVRRQLDEFVLEINAADRLAAAGLPPRSRLLLTGPPGTGKTLIAGHLAARLGKSFRIVRLDATISSLLGDTAKNIRSLFDYVMSVDGFLFMDEMDALAKKRDDDQELGELKRVVNTLLQALDALDHRAVIIGATNHPHLLDPAIWRRFPMRISFDLPSPELRNSLWRHYLNLPDLQSGLSVLLSKLSNKMSSSDIAEIATAARRRAIVHDTELRIFDVIDALLRSTGSDFVLPIATDERENSSGAFESRLLADPRLTSGDIRLLLSLT